MQVFVSGFDQALHTGGTISRRLSDRGGADLERLCSPGCEVLGSPAEDVFAMALACWPAFCCNQQRGPHAGFWPRALLNDPRLKLSALVQHVAASKGAFTSPGVYRWLPPLLHELRGCPQTLCEAARCVEAAAGLFREQRPGAAACAEALLAAAHDPALAANPIDLVGRAWVGAAANLRDVRAAIILGETEASRLDTMIGAASQVRFCGMLRRACARHRRIFCLDLPAACHSLAHASHAPAAWRASHLSSAR